MNNRVANVGRVPGADDDAAGKAEVRSSGQGTSNRRLSYKFQRLRERLRRAVLSGELQGKLPGERELAKRFNINAKTLSKALTDLAAEGLLVRSIGRGTYVRGSAPVEPSTTGKARWLILVDDPARPDELVAAVQSGATGIEAPVEVRLVPAGAPLRPSDLAGVKAIIDAGESTPGELIRDALLRNVCIVMLEKPSPGYSTHTVRMDRESGGGNLAREMLLLGHRRFFVVESRNGALAGVVRQLAERYDRDASVDVGSDAEAVLAVRHGVTAIICDSGEDGARVLSSLTTAGVRVPQDVSLAACGFSERNHPVCNGWYVQPGHVIDALVRLVNLGAATSGRPTTIWLAGAYDDRGTLAAAPMPIHADVASHAGRMTSA